MDDAALFALAKIDPDRRPDIGEPVKPKLITDSDGLPFIDYLGMAIENYWAAPSSWALELHRDAVHRPLVDSREEPRMWKKYRWVADYHNRAVQRYERGSAPLCIADVEPPL